HELRIDVVEGFSARALVEASRQAALVVVGRKGVCGFPGELIEPKAAQVVHHAGCPVAVVPEQWTGDGSGIVVGVDGSDHAARALRWAVDEAERRGAGVTAVLAWGLLDQYHVEPDVRFDPKYSAADAQAFVDHAVASALDGEAANVAAEVVNDLPA